MLSGGVLKLPEMNDYTHKAGFNKSNINIMPSANDCPIITFYFSALVIMVKTYPVGFEACLSAQNG